MNLPFVKQRQQRWTRLNQLIEKSVRRRLASFTKQELLEYNMLYRQAATDLALAKTLQLPDDLVQFLNDLVGRAYHQLYRMETSKLSQIGKLFGTEFPCLIRQNRLMILFSLGLLSLGWLCGFWGYLVGPQVTAALVPDGFVKDLLRQFAQNTWFNDPAVARPYLSARIMYNNIQVALMAFAGGMLLGTYTLYILIFNGYLLGVLAAAFLRSHHFLSFWAMILPHGVIELTAIAMAAAAGLLLAKTILFPGEYRREDALKLQGAVAVKLALGTVILLIIAGLIEGFFSTIDVKVIPEWGRLLFAAFTVIFLGWYVNLGRTSQVRRSWFVARSDQRQTHSS
jgi:uncharacterized membrane protein SpoIIM required for sporulation